MSRSNGLKVLAGLVCSTLAAASISAAGVSEAPAIGMPWAISAALPNNRLLTLADLSDFALRNNPATRAAWAGALVDRAGLEAALALTQPNLAFSLPLTLEHGGSAAPAVSRAVAPSLSLSWVLFDFGARAAGVDGARWQAAASQLGYNRTLQTVVVAVEQAYYGLLGARQLQGVLQLGLEAAQASLDVARAYRLAGLATAGDTAQAEAAWADAQLQFLRARAAARSAEGSLAYAVGLPVNSVLALAADDLSDLPGSAALAALPIDDLLATARTSRADLAALSALLQQSEAQVIAAQAQGRPSLGLSAQAARRWSNDAGNAAGAGTQGLALTLSIPLFDGGLVRAQVQAARARTQQLAAQRDQQRQTVELEVWQSFQLADNAQAVIAAAQALLRSASVADNAARERYSAGVGSLLELLLAQSSAAQARVSLVQARYDARLAVAQLGYAVGYALRSAPSNSSQPIP